jgi:hypothetical protein
MWAKLSTGKVTYPGIVFEDIEIRIENLLSDENFSVQLIELGNLEIGQDEDNSPILYCGEITIKLSFSSLQKLFEYYQLLIEHSTAQRLSLIELLPNGNTEKIVDYSLDKETVDINAMERTLELTFYDDLYVLKKENEAVTGSGSIGDIIGMMLFSLYNYKEIVYHTPIEFKATDDNYYPIAELSMLYHSLLDTAYTENFPFKTYADSFRALLNNLLSYAVIDRRNVIRICPQHYDGSTRVRALRTDEILNDGVRYESKVKQVKGIVFNLAVYNSDLNTWGYSQADYGTVNRDGNGDIENSDEVEELYFPTPCGAAINLTPFGYSDNIGDEVKFIWATELTYPNVINARTNWIGGVKNDKSLVDLFIELVVPLRMQVRRSATVTLHSVIWNFDTYYTLPGDERKYVIQRAAYNFGENSTELSLIEV